MSKVDYELTQEEADYIWNLYSNDELSEDEIVAELEKLPEHVQLAGQKMIFAQFGGLPE